MLYLKSAEIILELRMGNGLTFPLHLLEELFHFFCVVTNRDFRIHIYMYYISEVKILSCTR